MDRLVFDVAAEGDGTDSLQQESQYETDHRVTLGTLWMVAV